MACVEISFAVEIQPLFFGNMSRIRIIHFAHFSQNKCWIERFFKFGNFKARIVE